MIEVITLQSVEIEPPNSTIYRRRRELSDEQNNFAFQIKLQNGKKSN